MYTVVIDSAKVVGDHLNVAGTVNGEHVSARGWLSATTNHFPDDQWSKDKTSHIVGAKSRAMTAAEKTAYLESRLIEAYGDREESDFDWTK